MEIRVMQTAAFKAAYEELVPQFERASGHKVTTLWTPSVEMMSRLKGGETVDVTIMSASAIDELHKLGTVGKRVDLATSGVGVAVRAGAPKPDISSGDALKRAVLAAKSIVYSTGPSGIYLKDLFERWGIADAIKSKVVIVKGEPAGAVAARGEAEIAFQQVCELLPVAGIDLVGPLSSDIQKITTFSGAVHNHAAQADAAAALLKFLTAPAAAAAISKAGMQPA
jgi:molybdate transport system substrate-binding protein